MAKQYFIKLFDGKTHPYQLRLSNRAKRLSLKMSLEGDLSVVVPIGVKDDLAHLFVQQQAKWVEKQLNKAATQPRPKPRVITKPKLLDLKMINEEWSVKYVLGADNTIEYDELPDKCLQISGATQSTQLVQKIIGLFLKNKATLLFPHSVTEIASEYNFDFSHVKIRGQKGRWGSCSNQKILNLNYKLLFMPKNVAHYVFIHELCHTVEMNHSAKFWALVAKCDPDYKKHEQYLKEKGGVIRYF